MKVLLLNTHDINGGAARAAYRLHQGLQNIGVDSQMLVQSRLSNDSTITGPKTRLKESIAHNRIAIDALPLKFYGNRDKSTFSLQWLPEKTTLDIAKVNPDLINLHWINEAFLQVENLAKLDKPLVWTLHDMWAFTGGCHYTQGCNKYEDFCGSCPQLSSTRNWDLSRWVWHRKSQSWSKINFTIVALSSWLAKCARSSNLFQNQRIELIPNGIDTQKYKPTSRDVARKLLNLPLDKKLILFGSLHATSDKRKGFYLLQPALQQLSQSRWNDKLELAIFGSSKPSNPPELGFPTHYLGQFNDDLSLALVYCAADVFVLPSAEDNLPNTVMEALACGIPCVAFNIGGMPDLIEHQQNGYLAQPYHIEDLAQGIAWILENQERYQKISHRAREKVEHEFTLAIQARRYSALFEDIIARNNIS